MTAHVELVGVVMGGSHIGSHARGAIAAALVLAAGAAQAGAVRTIDCNIDAYNLTGQTANDFDILLRGTAPAQISRLFLRPGQDFPEVEVRDTADGALIHYHGMEVANGGRVHVGFQIFPAGPVGTIEQYWTWNGTPLGGPDFRCTPPLDPLDGRIQNTGISDVWVQRRVAIQENPVDLQNDLVRGSALWNAALLLDVAPVALDAGTTLDYRFGGGGHGSYTMMYDVCGDLACTNVLQTVLQSTFYTPEPALPLLLAWPAAWLLLSRRRPRLAGRA